MTPDDLLRRVALDFKLPASAITGRSQAADIRVARHAWWYLWAQLPLPDTLPGKGGSRRAATDRDGPVAMLARMTGRSRAGVRYGMRQTEDRRDDPDFDALISAIEYDMAKDTSDKDGN